MVKKRKDPAAVALGRKGGLAAAGAGWRAFMGAMTPEERSEHGRKAVMARWRKRKGKRKR